MSKFPNLIRLINSKRKLLLTLIGLIIVLGYLLPEKMIIPVKDATPNDWNHQTFWFEPWGKSGVHKGIDIFANKATPLISASYGIIIYQGQLGIGGNVIAVIGPKWKIHYYAHLDSINVTMGQLVVTGEMIGTTGDSGNAKGKPPHLHYSVVSLFPYLWRWDLSNQGWLKIFFLDPGELLLTSNQ